MREWRWGDATRGGMTDGETPEAVVKEEEEEEGLSLS